MTRNLKGVLCVALLATGAFLRPVPALAADTLQDFDADGVGTSWMPFSLGPPPACLPRLLVGGPTGEGRALRVTHGLRSEAGCPVSEVAEAPEVSSSSIAFDRTHLGAASVIVADFDLRLTPRTGRADGLGFALLDTRVWGTSGGVGVPAAPFVAEEPNFTGSLGIGFDIYRSPDLADVDENHVSVHFDGKRLAEFSVKGLFDLAGGEWFHVRVLVHAGLGSSEVTVEITPCSGRPVVVVDHYSVPGMSAYEARAYFAGRSGGLTSDFDLDNVHILFRDTEPELVSFVLPAASAREDGAAAEFEVRRTGDVADGVSVRIATEDLGTTAGADYGALDAVLTFAPAETSRTLTVPLLDDRETEGDERLRLRLGSPSEGAELGGPTVAVLDVVDDETARVEGHWSPVLCWPVVPIHLNLLPTGKVLFWGRVGTGELPDQEGGGATEGPFDPIRIWDPTTLELTTPALPPHDIFCSGHSFLADGRLLVAGGNVADFQGLPHVSAYDAFADAWSVFPDMNDGRWYPTTVPLANGRVAVESGDIEVDRVNTLPQILDPVHGLWRDLPRAQEERPPIADLFPRLLLAPDGRIFKAGPDRDSWFLDPRGAGHWVRGPLSSLNRPRTYAPAVIFDGTVLLIGGGDPPSETVDRIDLDDPSPRWQPTGSLALPRRHHNATLLPDGTVLVTGGTSSPGFNAAAAAVRFAEVWSPTTGSWTVLASMHSRRIYHSTAVLLPDARVLVAGGGQPNAEGDFDHADAEIFSPPYLFKGPRPVIASAPAQIGLGEVVEIETPQAGSIARVSLLRFGSATHAFDQDQRLVTPSFTVIPGGIEIELPSNPDRLPPGPYMLFLVDAQGVPSVAHMIRIEGLAARRLLNGER